MNTYARIDVEEFDTIVVGGDFNTHHPLWNPRGYLRQDNEADELIDIMSELGLRLHILVFGPKKSACDGVFNLLSKHFKMQDLDYPGDDIPMPQYYSKPQLVDLD
jgi:Endonuclease-reverse transcriptase